MRSTEAQEKKQSPVPNTVLHQKLETFTNTMLQSMQTKVKEEKTWAVLSMTGEILAYGNRLPQVDRNSDSLFSI
ncbi:hypothetical protein ND861_02445 [Leptospira sp. 2 VSF19]|uniref:Uncharacterized protein n=1 Tax=Leptospira soteropolitanensis TaxID=2950025 RepID=A0AAW5VCV9_9LEPT|nr:hypothetical protein [Leptospira soteropolitanensis]MCW7491507.1 hypothetical protein [Leptospira soteropolitanensis]MCW7499091.1 hypothetical protein [Leptospira soteropolitanensis]MCW7521317.1 hypothetical protein [Leptospira soteropolitanensis]MCW7525195.1 hypothetical protein [Leptospira soteropolitanensis]MCW7529062.1 hypothetical protein [Leptospira soteropolitanensis]